MASVIPYHVATWQKVPEALESFEWLEKTPITDDAFVAISQVFIEHGMEDKLALMLNHTHFPLEDGERLVEWGRVSTPWQLDGALEDVTSRIRDKSWAFIDGELRTYEFSFHESQSDEVFHQPPFSPAFVADLNAALSKFHLDTRLGVTSIEDGQQDAVDGLATFEYTTGRVSLLLPRSTRSDDDIIEVGWKFSKVGEDGHGKPIVVRNCYRCCRKCYG